MAACNLTIDFSGDANALIEKLRAKVAGQGGIFNGDTNSGDISVSVFGSRVSGSYTINGQQVNIIINEKPFLISCNQIKGFLVGNL